MMQDAKDKLIIALDVESAGCALDLFGVLSETAGMFKVGSQLFTAAGPDVVRQIVSRGGRVFLDLKFHDIPHTVANAAVEATRLGVSIFSVHAAGGVEMMKRTVEAVIETAAREGLAKPKVIAVTVLTSLDAQNLPQVGINAEPARMVTKLARLAADCGLDGVVASPHEIGIIRAAVSEAGFLIVTPGIRIARQQSEDQRRIMSAAEAVRAGADYVVVGRPVLKAGDPVLATRQIVAEIAEALRGPGLLSHRSAEQNQS